jgi:alpha-D-ribose 1-methylphosphonate 5-triphosphate synthase subunit PhnH
MLRESSYDEVFAAQRHFRTVLDSMSRPGKINRFAPVALAPPGGFPLGSAYLAFALLNADVAAHLAGYEESVGAYLRANTQCQLTGADAADFLFLPGTGDPAPLAAAKTGVPAYPEGGATVVVAVRRLSKSATANALELRLQGPGVESRAAVFVTGLHPGVLATIAAKQGEFPLGIDAILVSEDEAVVCVPRTSQLSWDAT